MEILMTNKIQTTLIKQTKTQEGIYMKKQKTQFLATGIALSASLFAGTVMASEETSDSRVMSKSVILGAYAGSNSTSEYLIGFGGLDSKNDWSKGYISHFTTDGATNSVSGFPISFGQYQSTRIGFSGEGFGNEKPFSGGAFIYKNQLENKLIDKYGVGFAIGGGFVINEQIKLGAEVEALPQFLSTNWDDKVYLEYAAEIKASYLITKTLKAKAAYKYGGMILNDSNYKLYDNFGAGVEVSF